MKPINIAGSISLATVKQTAAAPAAQAGTAASEGGKAFSSLLGSMVSHVQSEADQKAELPKELLEKMEEMLAMLQEQPLEDLTAGQQKILHELIQLLNFQPERKEGAKLVETGSGNKFIPVLPDLEKESASKEIQAKLVELLKKMNEVLPVGSATDTPKIDLALASLGGKEDAIPAENTEKILSKILEFTETLVASGKNLTVDGVSSEKPDKLLKVFGDTKTDTAIAESVKGQQPVTAEAAERHGEGQQQEFTQQEDGQPGMTATSADSAKSSSVSAQPIQTAQIKPDQPAAPTPVVRMNNLTEELGEVFKNSMRLTSNGDSTQIKVNISPDHLGHLDIRLTETNGKIAAQIFTSSIAAKEALDLQLSQLRSTLIQQGLTVEKVEIVQHNSQQSLGQQNAQSEQRFFQQDRQNNQRRDSNGYQQLEEKAVIKRDHLDAGTLKVDYTV